MCSHIVQHSSSADVDQKQAWYAAPQRASDLATVAQHGGPIDASLGTHENNAREGSKMAKNRGAIGPSSYATLR